MMVGEEVAEFLRSDGLRRRTKEVIEGTGSSRRSSKAPGRSALGESTTTGGGSSRGGHDPADLVSAVSEPCELGDDSMTPGGSAAVVDEPRRLIHRRDKPAGVWS